MKRWLLAGALALSSTCGESVEATPGKCVVTGVVTAPPPTYGPAVVYVEGPGAPATAGLSLPEVHQNNKQFAPRAMVVAKGTPIAFPNDDHVFHHLYSPGPTDPFSLHQHAGGERPTRSFDVPGDVVLKCNIHHNMEMWVLVLENDLYAFTDAAGRFTLTVPPDTREVRVWEAGHALARVPVACSSGGVVSIAPTLARRAAAPGWYDADN